MGFLKKFENHLIAPKADINLQFTDQYAVVGDNFEGTLAVTPHEDIQAEEIRCEIKCTETAQVIRNVYDPACKCMVARQETEVRVLYQAKPPCNPAIGLSNGGSHSFKFSIPIPAGARPTYESVNDNIKWEIKGVIAVHGRPDVTTKELILQVIPQGARPANQPPKIRLVNCQYCQGAMPEDAITCPNCGARRTV